jgi:hypothetical protein
MILHPAGQLPAGCFVYGKQAFHYFYSMNKKILFIVLIISALISCKKKKTGGDAVGEKSYIDVVSIIKSEVKHVDTSLYNIVKLVSTDTLDTDTTYIKREDFEKEVSMFLALPNLSNQDVANDFKDESRFDTLTQRAFISYFPKEEDNEIKKIEVIAKLDEIDSKGNNKVTNIIAEKRKTDRNGSSVYKMYWNANRNFSIIHFVNLPGQPEKITTTKVTWNDDSFQ